MIRALVIDDSAYNRVTISRMLESAGDIEVIATANNGEEAIKQVMKHSPDVITLDLEMPVMDGFSFLRWLMQNRPTPVIAVSSKSSDRSVFKALDLGAIDFISKPGGNLSPRLEEIQKDLIAKVRHVAEVRIENVRKRSVEAAFRPPAPAETGAYTYTAIQLIAIGCSTGGPPALQHLFQSLPLMPIPIVVAQHMPPTFTRLFAERVDRLTKYSVKEAEDGEKLANGSVYVAPGGMQMEVRRTNGGLGVRITTPGPDDLYAPSVDRLFASASDACGEKLLAVIMTGMGDDGARAIRRVRDRGGKTIAESSDTAIIFGMPNEAIKTGAVDQILPLSEIAAAIERLTRVKFETDERRVES
ncbi:MAG: chemotaxis response regulator protein-glutamate methylesterase [Acidobacteria bacterium]|nr:MAG: chemotaxis response regulator protein-glutamate methylesterase [Acidobacteriota bacterium]